MSDEHNGWVNQETSWAADQLDENHFRQRALEINREALIEEIRDDFYDLLPDAAGFAKDALDAATERVDFEQLADWVIRTSN
ncbi:hypothetical protein D3C81_1830060 [compost metagenome]